MNIEETIKLIKQTDIDLTNTDIQIYWGKCLEGDLEAINNIKYYYMKLLSRVKPLYKNIEDKDFYLTIETSVTKALDRAIKFKVEDFVSYMSFASQTYFKYNILPEKKSDSLNIPSILFKAFSKIDDVYKLIPSLEEKDEQIQINLLSIGFEYPIFLTRLLYYSYKKWVKNNLRQVDIDLCVALLPAPQRVEWEIFYEKDIEDIKNTILNEIG
ncbi:MAG: hypothetical protein AB7V16_11520 [Vulcanibacillus sp.]